MLESEPLISFDTDSESDSVEIALNAISSPVGIAMGVVWLTFLVNKIDKKNRLVRLIGYL